MKSAHRGTGQVEKVCLNQVFGLISKPDYLLLNDLPGTLLVYAPI